MGLSPASLPKRGSWFDLAIAVGILAAAGVVPRAAVAGVMFFGELGLDGRLRPVRGVLPAVAAAARAGFGTVLVSAQNAAEAALVPGVRVIAAGSLAAAADWLRGTPGRHDGVSPAFEYDRVRAAAAARSARGSGPAAAGPPGPRGRRVGRERRGARVRGHRIWLRCWASRWPGRRWRCARPVLVSHAEPTCGMRRSGVTETDSATPRRRELTDARRS